MIPLQVLSSGVYSPVVYPGRIPVPDDTPVPAIATPEDSHPFHAIFIRAPLIESVGDSVEVLAKLDNGSIVAARQGHLLVTSFHPELSGDDRFHRYFVSWAV